MGHRNWNVVESKNSFEEILAKANNEVFEGHAMVTNRNNDN